VLLVNPIIDGMNLVSKEGPLVNKGDGVVILSELAGSFEQLQEYVLPVSPADLEGTLRALHQALTMPDNERRQRADGLRKQVEDNDIVHWLEAQFKDLLALSEHTL
jgi:trehalose 6-phosphate synthase